MRRGVWWLVAACCLAGCGSSDPAEGLALPDLAATCARVQQAQKLPVLCAPASEDPAFVLVHDDLDEAPCQYLMNLEGKGEAGGGEHRHVVLSGRCGAAPLRADASGRWDIAPPDSLRLAGAPPYRSNGQPSPSRPRVVRRLEVRGHPGLLLRADPFPDGGAQGGHDSVVWIEGGATYAVSVHRPVGENALVELAEQLRPV